QTVGFGERVFEAGIGGVLPGVGPHVDLGIGPAGPLGRETECAGGTPGILGEFEAHRGVGEAFLLELTVLGDVDGGRGIDADQAGVTAIFQARTCGINVVAAAAVGGVDVGVPGPGGVGVDEDLV